MDDVKGRMHVVEVPTAICQYRLAASLRMMALSVIIRRLGQ